MKRQLAIILIVVISLCCSCKVYSQRPKDPIPLLNGIADTAKILTFEQLDRLDSVYSSVAYCRIISFDLTLKFKDDLITLKSYSSHLTSEQKKLLRSNEAKGKLTNLYLERIQGICNADGIFRFLYPLSFEIRAENKSTNVLTDQINPTPKSTKPEEYKIEKEKACSLEFSSETLGEPDMKLHSYDVVVNRNGEASMFTVLGSKLGKGNMLSGEVRTLLCEAKKGYKFYFEKIKLQKEDGTFIIKRPVTYTIE